MYYFDYLRVRGALRNFALWFAAATALLALLLPFSSSGHGNLSVGVSSATFDSGRTNGLALLHDLGRHVAIPFALLCAIAVGIAILFAGGRCRSLSRDNRNLHFAFTKPVSRERAALTTFAFDAGAVVVAFAIAFALLLVPIAETGNLDRITFGGSFVQPVLFGFGIALMWYGMLQAATCWLRNGGAAAFGVSIVAFILVANAQAMTALYFPEGLVFAVHVLGRLDPLVYLERMIARFNGVETGASVLDPVYLQNVAAVYAIGIACLAAAVVLRKRMEI